MKKAVICFTRVPQPGTTKTRLLPVLKPEQCAGLHWAFLMDLAGIYRQLDADLFVAYTPDPDWEKLQRVFPEAVGFFPQSGADLGEKMYRALRNVRRLGYEAVVLTGADLPDMGKAHLESGFSALEEADMAIGPTSDGGYYLIGMKEPTKAVFRISGYGGASVYENTVAVAKAAGLTVAEAMACDDVDTPADLHSLASAADHATHTGRYLDTLKKEGVSL